MDELQHLFATCKIADVVHFDHQTNCVWCYTHIINICCSHIIASFTSVSKPYLSQLKVPLDLGSVMCDDSDSDNESECSDDDYVDDQDYDLALPSFCSGRGDDDADKLDDWIKCIKGDPLKRARRVIRILRSSDEHRIGLQQAIQDGNKHCWFTEVNKDGKRTPVTLPQVQLLRDVKTRWDSVYLMLECLRTLRPVSWSYICIGQ